MLGTGPRTWTIGEENRNECPFGRGFQAEQIPDLAAWGGQQGTLVVRAPCSPARHGSTRAMALAPAGGRPGRRAAGPCSPGEKREASSPRELRHCAASPGQEPGRVGAGGWPWGPPIGRVGLSLLLGQRQSRQSVWMCPVTSSFCLPYGFFVFRFVWGFF